MEQFTEEHGRLLLNKEWMIKIDSGKATPYLLKYHLLPVDLTCLIMVTDTKMVWAEVVSSKVLARRWRLCNPTASEYSLTIADEDAWRERVLELISKAHTMGGITDLSFEVVDSNYSDLSLEIGCDVFKWRWETCFLGYQRSSEIISKHLIFPLISLNHLSFSSAEALGELSDTDLEKSVDKVGRTARRTVDTHIKNALSKPRVATAIRRMSAIFNFVEDLPPIASIAEKPYLHMEEVEKPQLVKRSDSREHARDNTPKLVAGQVKHKHEQSSEVAETKIVEPTGLQPKDIEPAGSETESDSYDAVPVPRSKSGSRPNIAGPSRPTEVTSLDRSSRIDTPSVSQVTKPDSDSDSPPHRPVKKIKSISSDDDSDNDHKDKGPAGGASGGGIKRGTRQPIKRGGKRF